MKVFVRVSEGIANTGGGACEQSSINSFVFSITTLQPPKTGHIVDKEHNGSMYWLSWISHRNPCLLP